MQFTMTQDIALPANPSVVLTWKDRLQWNFTLTPVSALARDYFVELLNPTTSALLATLYSFTTGPETTNPTGNTGWLTHTADVSAFAGSTVRLRFREVIPESSTGPGQAEFDAIAIDTSTASDWYKFTLAAGETASVELKALSSGTVNLQLRDSTGATLANAIAGPANLDRVLTDFTAATAGTYYLEVAGGTAGVGYSLVVTKNAEFNIEPNSTIAQAQQVVSRQSAGEQFVLGHVGASGDGADIYLVNIAAAPIDGPVLHARRRAIQ